MLTLSFTPLIAFAEEAATSTIESNVPAPTEAQVRQVLIKLLEGEPNSSTDSDNPSGIDGSGYGASQLQDWQGDSMANSLASRLHELKDKLPQLPQAIKDAFAQTTDADKSFSWQRVVFTITLACALGLALEYLTTRKLLRHLHQYVDGQEKTYSLKIKYILLRSVIQILGFMALFVASYACELMSLYGNPFYEILHTEVLKALILFRVVATVSRNVFSPHHKELRMVSLDCRDATNVYRWSMLFITMMYFGGATLTYLMRSDMDKLLATGLIIPYSLILNGLLIGAAWFFRKAIVRMFLDADEHQSHQEIVQQQGFAKQTFIQIWPALFTAWMFAIWGSWLFNTFMGNQDAASSISIAWWVTLVFPILDRVVFAILKNVSHIEWLQSPFFEQRAKVFRKVVQTGFRAVALITAIVTAFYAWGFETGGLVSMTMGTDRLWRLIDILITICFVYIVWTLISAYIERKLPVEETALASLEGDAGGGGASRSETLLPLIRSILNVVFVIFLILSVLHSMGISIAPVLAGAGVVGIAIGFGAQKLVQDILSGMFFLIDDAFRRGEYIEIENLRGTVEQISLRSMQLRHHLGAVQTIPYGEIKTVRNLSRDWVTMKLELRLPYETDIEKVRKIIKKTGQKMLENEEWGQNFILPLKSQGVMRVDDSALIVRMKFTSKPGEQWVLRREAYRLVRDALEEQGIYFARREVRVLLPETPALEGAMESSDNSAKPTLAQAAGAAAMSVLAAEAAANAKLDGADEGGELE
ncbi:MAG: mechanosensitive ion channel family protein [Granulosicoccaceae bacterium]